MEHAVHKNIKLVSVLAIGLALGACALQPQQGTPAQLDDDATTTAPAPQDGDTPAASPHDSDAEGDAVALDSEIPAPDDAAGLQLPDIAALDDAQSESALNGEDAAAKDGGGDNNVDTAASDQGDDTIDGDSGGDLWDRIRLGFGLTDQQNTRIERETKWFGRHQEYLDRVADRAQPYLHYIVNQVQQRGMPSEIALLPVVESAFQPYAYSAGRAAGIWQFIPGTGRRYGLELNWWYDGRRDIVASTRAALDYLQYLHDSFDGDWLLALAAYNSGEGTVHKAIRNNRRRHRPTDYWSLRLPRETEQYVPRLLALRQIVADPAQQGITLRSIPDEPYLTAVKIDSQLDLATAAKLADMDLEELHQLNPGFNRWATAPDGPHRLLLPLEKAPTFAINVAGLSPEDRVHWVRHRIRNGETLGGIANHYHTTVKVLTDLNNIRGHFIRAGHHLIIPITSRNDPVHRAVRHIHIPREVIKARHKTIHTVVAGDSLWVLAHRYGTTVRKICHWNGISSRKMLHPGQKLVVGLGGTASRSTGIMPTSLHMFAASEEVAKPRRITYTVRRGDSLSRISQRFRVTVQQVRKWNDIHKNEYLQPGQELTLYITLAADSERG